MRLHCEVVRESLLVTCPVCHDDTELSAEPVVPAVGAFAREHAPCDRRRAPRLPATLWPPDPPPLG